MDKKFVSVGEYGDSYLPCGPSEPGRHPRQPPVSGGRTCQNRVWTGRAPAHPARGTWGGDGALDYHYRGGKAAASKLEERMGGLSGLSLLRR